MSAKTQAFFEQLVNQCFWEVQQHSPIDTGNLRYNAIKLEKEGNDYVIYVDQKIAPYMVFTNEPWISDKWGGKQNPNEGWFDKVAELVAKKIASALGGKIEE